MNRQDSLRRQAGERPAYFTPQNEAELQTALEEGNEKSSRTWKGKRYGVLA